MLEEAYVKRTAYELWRKQWYEDHKDDIGIDLRRAIYGDNYASGDNFIDDEMSQFVDCKDVRYTPKDTSQMSFREKVMADDNERLLSYKEYLNEGVFGYLIETRRLFENSDFEEEKKQKLLGWYEYYTELDDMRSYFYDLEETDNMMLRKEICEELGSTVIDRFGNGGLLVYDTEDPKAIYLYVEDVGDDGMPALMHHEGLLEQIAEEIDLSEINDIGDLKKAVSEHCNMTERIEMIDKNYQKMDAIPLEDISEFLAATKRPGKAQEDLFSEVLEEMKKIKSKDLADK